MLVIARSSRFEWPPAGAEAVSAMTAAVEALEIRVLAAEWQPLPPGDAWYARRFSWASGGRAPTPLSRFERGAARIRAPRAAVAGC